jgi:hypothetical protein
VAVIRYVDLTTGVGRQTTDTRKSYIERGPSVTQRNVIRESPSDRCDDATAELANLGEVSVVHEVKIPISTDRH